jgi:hypothetical protein
MILRAEGSLEGQYGQTRRRVYGNIEWVAYLGKESEHYYCYEHDI